MRDKTPVKIICRIITLITYVCVMFAIVMEGLTEAYNTIDIIVLFFESPMRVIIACSVILVITMIIAIILKYSVKPEHNLSAYRIYDVFARLFCTSPLTMVASYYIFKMFNFEMIVAIIISILVFVAINAVMRFTLQEAMSTSFVTSDNL
ncbi:MAG: hypothetical protein IKQ71_07690 [Lachnospiraceae bacterium]|nr:hypothetical protein [Lachnospiraceae bacterium]